MKRLFISADIEGTAGITSLEDTDPSAVKDYPYFAEQMTQEVAAACEGAHRAGIEEIFIKDGHWNGKNLKLDKLPPYARVFRGWSGHPFFMMSGLDRSFTGVVFTGYHSGAGTDTHPLSHTINGSVGYIKINGLLASELYINALTCAYVGVPIFCVCGDKGICEQARCSIPGVATVETVEGTGAGVCTIHPGVAVERIRETVEMAVCGASSAKNLPSFPAHFEVETCFKDHRKAYRGSFYPGAEKTGPCTLRFSSGSWWDVLCFFSFVL